MKIFKNLTWLFSILMMGIFIIHEVFGIINKYLIVNIILYLVFIILLILNFIVLGKSVKSKTEKVYALFMISLMSILSVIVLILFLINYSGNKIVYEVYEFPNNPKEQLTVAFLNELGENTKYIIYEQKLNWGFSCHVNLKVDKNMTVKYDLNKIYQELIENKDAGFCYYSLRKY